ncbi:hypothetical protein D9611_002326 [Ephemerocybe angulata]|uniref:Uncharacterized protein n=1 Tax=Ephemerocybe angulata TaxID=980116 RepID=A0A8H5C1L3_9AGAR|nr:hypothetical protein D9611_002326 [Tulosesus angulatus]
MSTPLPSFVELMASLGLEQKPAAAVDPTEPTLSPPSSPKIPSPVKAKSSPSLREVASRQRTTRFSPYTSGNTSTRRGSVSSTSSYSSSSRGNSPIQETFGPQSTAPRARRSRNALCLNIYGSTSDLMPANMPISTYVRRKTPATTPTSPTFPQDTGSDATSDIPMTLTIPVLPTLLPNSASSEAFPITPKDLDATFPDRLSPRMPKRSLNRKPSPEYLSEHHAKGRARGNSHCQPYFTGVRISTASRYSLNEQFMRKDALVDTA